MDKVTNEMLLARKSVLTQAEYDALMEHRNQARTETWTPFERAVRLPLLKLRGRV